MKNVLEFWATNSSEIYYIIDYINNLSLESSLLAYYNKKDDLVILLDITNQPKIVSLVAN